VSGLLRVLPITLASFFAIGMGLLINSWRQEMPPVTQDPGPYITMGITLVAVQLAFVMQELRIRKLEERLEKLDATGNKPST
jgi:hypothetical protein